MTVSSTPATQSSSSAAQAAANSASNSSNAIGSQNAFLQLLVTQMQNQDPLNPMDNAQITSQLAQISTVNGITSLNTSVQQLIAASNANQTISAAGMLGGTVLVPGSTLNLSSGQAVYGINLAQAASNVQVTIKDASGNTVSTINLGAQPAGVTALSWNGAESNGGTASSGGYTFSVSAVQGTTAVTSTALSSGVVQGVVQGTNGTLLNLGSTLGNVPVTSVQQIM
jgi:flagellar basal-body rod modification protein FlgD